MRGGGPHHAAVLTSISLEVQRLAWSCTVPGTDLSSWTVAVGVLHAVVVLGRWSTPALELSVGLVALGQGVDKLVAAHVHPQS